MKVIIDECARREIDQAVEHYDNERIGLGQEFADEVEAAMASICQMPEAWPRILGNVRQHRTERFPYGIVYEPRSESIVVFAVMHLHRKPRYWRHWLRDRQE